MAAPFLIASIVLCTALGQDIVVGTSTTSAPGSALTRRRYCRSCSIPSLIKRSRLGSEKSGLLRLPAAASRSSVIKWRQARKFPMSVAVNITSEPGQYCKHALCTPPSGGCQCLVLSSSHVEESTQSQTVHERF